MVEENEFLGSQNRTINLLCDTSGAFAPDRWCRDVTIRSNRITRSGVVYLGGNAPSGIGLSHHGHPDVPERGRPHRDITIEDNDLNVLGFRGIEIQNAERVTAEGNDIDDVNCLEYPDGGYGFDIARVPKSLSTGTGSQDPTGSSSPSADGTRLMS